MWRWSHHPTLAASATQLELIVALYGVAFAVCLAMGS
ncbi:MFS transporter [Klebsiella pneumoniae]|uniref:MFS transporter n=1 Tax=Klebsiella pneumoniae TaxID=573 RepID=A0A377XNR6_KLEPN|nr:MFS transporter [Klebsiella pneumoniae]